MGVAPVATGRLPRIPPWSASRVGNKPTAVVGRLTTRKAARSGVLWGYVFGLYTATQAFAYASAYPTEESRLGLVRVFGSSAGIAAIVGPARDIDTVAGYTVWKCLGVLAIMASVWGLLLSTRLLRGEEDAGRYELLLAGQTTRRGAAAQAVAGLAAGVLSCWLVSAVIIALAGRSSKLAFSVPASLFFAIAIVAGAAMFAAVGALTSQLASTRRQAAGYAAVLLGISYGIRMIADSGVGIDWLRWASPLGWVEELQPMTSPQPIALLPIAALTLTSGGLAIHLAGRRDLGASTLPANDTAPPRTGLLTGTLGLTLRLVRPTMLAWTTAIVALSLLLGLIANSAGTAITSSSTLEHAFQRLGAAGANGYLGVAFLLVALLLVLIGAGQISAARSEEADGRLENLVVRPVSRLRWFSDRMLVAAGAIVAGSLLAGIVTAAGAAIGGAGVGFGRLLGAGLNVAAPALCILGIGALLLGVWPRAASVGTYAVIAWSFLVVLVGSVVHLNTGVLDTSVFHHMTAAPAVDPDWAANGVMAVIGLAGAVVGCTAFRRRDLASA